MALLTDGHAIQLRVYMDTLPNVFNVVSGTLISAPILSCNALCKITRLDTKAAAMRTEVMRVRNNHAIMHSLFYSPFPINPGVTTSTIVLNSIVGNVSMLFFTIRGSVVGTNAWNYMQLASFSINDAAGTSQVGGVPIPASYASLLLNKDWMKSSYNTETSFGTTDNKANVHMWSFSADPVASISGGLALTSRRFTGGEQLVLTFPAALSSGVQLEVYAYVESIVDQSLSSIKKISL